MCAYVPEKVGALAGKIFEMSAIEIEDYSNDE